MSDVELSERSWASLLYFDKNKLIEYIDKRGVDFIDNHNSRLISFVMNRPNLFTIELIDKILRYKPKVFEYYYNNENNIISIGLYFLPLDNVSSRIFIDYIGYNFKKLYIIMRVLEYTDAYSLLKSNIIFISTTYNKSSVHTSNLLDYIKNNSGEENIVAQCFCFFICNETRKITNLSEIIIKKIMKNK